MRRSFRPSVFVATAFVAVGAASALGAFSTASKGPVAVPYNLFTDATATCKKDQHVNWGGFKAETDPSFAFPPVTWLHGAGPVGPDKDKWKVTASSNTASGGELTSIAYCKGGKEPKVVKQTKVVTLSIEGSEIKSVYANCPKDRIVIGGGWEADYAGAEPKDQRKLAIMQLSAPDDDTWQVGVFNETGAEQSVTAIALCGTGKAPVVKTDQVPIPETQDRTAVAKCPGDTKVLFGGFAGQVTLPEGINAYPFKLFKAGDDKVKAQGAHHIYKNPSDIDSSELTAIAYCR